MKRQMIKLFDPVRFVELVGHRPKPQDGGLPPFDAPMMKISWREAEHLRAQGRKVYYWLNGACQLRPLRVAYRWKAAAHDVLAANPTPSMRARAERAIRRLEEFRAHARAEGI
jgi:hypothetical protein